MTCGGTAGSLLPGESASWDVLSPFPFPPRQKSVCLSGAEQVFRDTSSGTETQTAELRGCRVGSHWLRWSLADLKAVLT